MQLEPSLCSFCKKLLATVAYKCIDTVTIVVGIMTFCNLTTSVILWHSRHKNTDNYTNESHWRKARFERSQEILFSKVCYAFLGLAWPFHLSWYSYFGQIKAMKVQNLNLQSPRLRPCIEQKTIQPVRCGHWLEMGTVMMKPTMLNVVMTWTIVV